ncbi:MAG: ATP-binding protein [Caldilineaceae bacterium]
MSFTLVSQNQSLLPEQLYQTCTLAGLDFTNSNQLEDLLEFLGQDRALRAIQFGVAINRHGYNIFALGESGTGKQSLVRQTIEQQAKQEPPPPDWCYVNNFEEAHRPWALQLPAGKGKELRSDMQRLVEELQSALTAAFDSEEVQSQRQRIGEEYRDRQEAALGKLENKARKKGFSLLKTQAGVAFAPVRNGDVISPEEMDKLPVNEKSRIIENMESLQSELQKAMFKVPGWERELRKRIRALDQQVAGMVVTNVLDDLLEKYQPFPLVIDYLHAVQKDVVEHLSDFVNLEVKVPEPAEDDQGFDLSDGESPLRRYGVNVMVDASAMQGAPVLYESNPTYLNMVGRVEQMAQMGALVTDFLLIKPGVLHRANGGYLILDASKVLSNPYAWEGLKRSLQFGEIRIETPLEMLNMSSTMSVEPEPIPLDVKVILLGDPELYYVLAEEDPEFNELFKVAADFDDEVNRTPQMEKLYARLLATIARREKLRPFDRPALCRVIEESARIAGDAERLTTRMQEMVDLLEESDHWAASQRAEIVTAAHVQQAIDAQIYRSSRIPQRLREEVLRNVVLIDTAGDKIGQINGLSVVSMGKHSFGEPTRITATVGLGKGDVVNIEREVQMSGPSHTKGVLILSSYLRSRYASDVPLSLTASLVFEQSYGGVDGDSASSTELYALLSAIAEAPIKQSLAVTGSVNQFGQVQAIGGVNEKIEGFFDLCKARGLTGEQGVLIPVANTKHLMLRQDIVDAVRQGQFRIYAIASIDQGIELLTGIPAGVLQADGGYPEGTINRRVADRLSELAHLRRKYDAD